MYCQHVCVVCTINSPAIFEKKKVSSEWRVWITIFSFAHSSIFEKKKNFLVNGVFGNLYFLNAQPLLKKNFFFYLMARLETMFLLVQELIKIPFVLEVNWNSCQLAYSLALFVRMFIIKDICSHTYDYFTDKSSVNVQSVWVFLSAFYVIFRSVGFLQTERYRL